MKASFLASLFADHLVGHVSHTKTLLRFLFFYFFFLYIEALLDVTMVIEKPAVAYNEEAVLKCVAEPQYFQDDYFPFGLQADIGTGENLTSDRVLER